ncbi:MAG: glycosyltransferase family 2 protein [Candidatus Omnitrophota bacterium]|nr:glycosyltransferase family 2 protein [Candidatus Omnitrophota bacterium]
MITPSTSGSDRPRITLVTPSYQQADFLEATILSVFGQNYPNLEYILVDGGSTDGSLEIIKRYREKLSFWVSEKDRGQSDAINKGFLHSTGMILGWLNSDDMLEPGALRHVAETLAAPDTERWLIGAGRIIDADGRPLFHRSPAAAVTRKSLLRWHKNWFAQPSTFWTRSLWEKAGPLDPDLHYAQDLDLWLRMKDVAEPVITTAVLSVSRFHKNAKGYKDRYEVARAIAGITKKRGRHRERLYLLLSRLELAANYLWNCCSDRVKKVFLQRQERARSKGS